MKDEKKMSKVDFLKDRKLFWNGKRNLKIKKIKVKIVLEVRRSCKRSIGVKKRSHTCVSTIQRKFWKLDWNSSFNRSGDTSLTALNNSLHPATAAFCANKRKNLNGTWYVIIIKLYYIQCRPNIKFAKQMLSIIKFQTLRNHYMFIWY